MKLPKMRYSSGIKKVQQVKFAGLDHSVGGGEGSLWDMQNLTSDHYPVLATRPRRGVVANISEPAGIFAAGGIAEEDGAKRKLCYVSENHFYFDGVDKGALREPCNGQTRFFAQLQGIVAIFPDKMYYDIREDVMGDMESQWAGAQIQFMDGTYAGANAEANTIYCKGANFEALFRVGDGVSIEGCTAHPENNKTLVIREIDGDYLRFYENAFVLNEGEDTYQENGEMTISRRVPDLVCVCTHNNRLWGADSRTIYAARLGDIFCWYNLDGEMNGWQWEAGSSGSFTACVSYRGYPTFFKEDMIYKVYGSVPSNFQTVDSATLGVIEGGGRSLAVAGETLFYLGRNGITAYQGGIPSFVGEPMGSQRFTAGVAGSDGMKYYVSLQDAAGRWRLYVYDTQKGLWHIEDDQEAVGFVRCEGQLYMLTSNGDLLTTYGSNEEQVPWWAEFGDITEKQPNQKGISSLQIRLELEAGANMQVMIQYDSCGIWEKVGHELRAEHKKSLTLPVIPRRCDHYRLRLEGVGQCYIYSLTREFYVGSSQ